MNTQEKEIQRLRRLLQFRVWLGAVIGVPLAVGTGLALVFFMTLAEPVPAQPITPGIAAIQD